MFDIAFEGHSVIFLRVGIVSLFDYLCHKITHKRNAKHSLILLVPYFSVTNVVFEEGIEGPICLCFQNCQDLVCYVKTKRRILMGDRFQFLINEGECSITKRVNRDERRRELEAVKANFKSSKPFFVVRIITNHIEERSGVVS